MRCCSGEAILPEGLVEEGHKIIACKGNVARWYIPTNILLGAFDFE